MDGSQRSSEEAKNVDVYTAKGLLDIGYRYLDVRTKEEFENGHVEGALNIPYMFMTKDGRVKNQDFITQVSEVTKKNDQLVVACNSGGRGLKATIDLQIEMKEKGYFEQLSKKEEKKIKMLPVSAGNKGVMSMLPILKEVTLPGSTLGLRVRMHKNLIANFAFERSYSAASVNTINYPENKHN